MGYMVEISMDAWQELVAYKTRFEDLMRMLEVGVSQRQLAGVFKTNISGKLEEYEKTGLTPEKIRDMRLENAKMVKKTADYDKKEAENAKLCNEIIRLQATVKELQEVVRLLESASEADVPGAEPAAPAQEQPKPTRKKSAAPKSDDEHKMLVKKVPYFVAKPKRKITNYDDLDFGMIGALHQAGWTLDKIAVECNCNVELVERALKQMRA